MKKRLLASVLSLAMVATMMPAALADDVTDGGSMDADQNTSVSEEFDASTLQYKINNDADGKVVLTDNIAEDITIAKDKKITLDLNGKTLTIPHDQGLEVLGELTITGDGAITCSQTPIRVDEGKVTIENGTISSDNNYGIYVLNGGTVMVNGGTLTSDYAVLTGNNTTGDMNFEVNGGTLTSRKSEAIYMPGQMNLDVNGGIINGGISARMGQINVMGGTINGMTTAQTADSMAKYYNYSGSAWIGDAIYIWGGTYNSNTSYYGNTANVCITGGTINGNAHRAVAVYDIGNNYNQNVTVIITGNAQVSGDVVLDDTYGPHTHKVNSDFRISGGIFTTDVSKYCYSGWTAIRNTDEDTNAIYKYMIGKLPVNEENKINTDTSKGDTVANIGENIKNEDRTAAEEVANKVDTKDTIVDSQEISDDEKRDALIALKNAGIISVDDTGKIENTAAITVDKKTYLDVTVNDYNVAGDSNTYKISMDITPKCNLIATTDKDNQTEENSVTFSKGNLMKVTAKTNVTVTLPSVFANKLVYINHDNKELYTATADKDGKITFETNGFSPFTFTLTKPSGFDNGSSGGSSGGGSSSSSTYKVTVATVSNGSAKASTSTAAKDATVTVTLSPDKGYKLDKITVTDASGKEIATTKKSDTSYTFTMPASAVTVKVAYVKDDAAVVEPSTGFNDVADRDWFADAVKYVADKGMMNGTSKTTFGPNDSTTRGMIVTVLYRLENEPSAAAASFTDVVSGQYYTDAVAWANANGIVTGYGNGKFGPNDVVTREQLAAILYRYAQYKKYDVSVGEDTNILSYADAQSVSAYAIPAMQWAGGAGIVNGSNGKLNPQNNATRAEVATMLMRYCEKVAK